MNMVKGLALCLALVLGVVGLVAQTPEWQWTVRAGGTGDDYCWDITSDNQGNQYITGWFEGVASFGPYTLTSSGGRDIFAAKLDPDGNFLWAVSAGGASYDEGWDITVDEIGNTYLNGRFQETATFGPYTLTSSGETDIFVAKLGPGTPAEDE